MSVPIVRVQLYKGISRISTLAFTHICFINNDLIRILILLFLSIAFVKLHHGVGVVNNYYRKQCKYGKLRTSFMT